MNNNKKINQFNILYPDGTQEIAEISIPVSSVAGLENQVSSIRFIGLEYPNFSVEEARFSVQVLQPTLIQAGDILQVCKRKKVYCKSEKNTKNPKYKYRQVKKMYYIITEEDIQDNKEYFFINLGEYFTEADESEKNPLEWGGDYAIRIRRPIYDVNTDTEIDAIYSNAEKFRTNVLTACSTIETFGHPPITIY